MLLVGNVNDGRINAFDPTTVAFAGVVRDASGKPIGVPGYPIRYAMTSAAV
jgi:hypothetical protein